MFCIFEKEIAPMSKGILLTPDELRKKTLERTYTERFDLLIRLIRINKMLRSATIIPAKK